MYKLIRNAQKKVALKMLELVCIYASYLVSVFIISNGFSWSIYRNNIWILIVFMPLFTYTMESLGMYKKTTFNYPDRIFKNVLWAVLLGNAVPLVISMLLDNNDIYIKFFAILFVSSLIYILVTRFVFTLHIKNNRNKYSEKAVIIGCGQTSADFVKYLKKTSLNIDIIGCIKVQHIEHDEKQTVLGHVDDIEVILETHIIDEVIIVMSQSPMELLANCIKVCEQSGVTVKLIPDLFDYSVAKPYFYSVGPLPVLAFSSICLNDNQLFVKRIMDIIGSIVGLILTFFVGLFIIPIIYFESKGPIFFKQTRVGQKGRKFSMYKFRSMVKNAEDLKGKLASKNEVDSLCMFKITNDPRTTKVGKFIRRTSIDEMPQFWNVLKGDMSLVGTRPPTVDEVKIYQLAQRRRISIKPGMTGLWQVNGRSNVKEFEKIVEYDLEYIDNWTIWSDIKILLKTFIVLLTRDGAE